MQYVSTRGTAPTLDFEDVLLAGLATDGGLYVPQSWPTWDPQQFKALRGKPYPEIAAAVMRPFLGSALPNPVLDDLLADAYATFRHAAIAPLVQLGPRHFVMELFHGPTLAFKDVAMQVLGRLYDHVLTERDQHVTLIGATSGDTGGAAIEAIKGRDRASIVILHPHNRTSEVQRRQMTTVDAPNVHNLAIDGTFDDCQALVKAMFNDMPFRERVGMSGVNSINWARCLPQAVYYVAAALALGGPDRPVAFSVPTGNFGDVFAGYAARHLGLPIPKLVVASNINDILTRALHSGDHALGEVHRTHSPSMDIQVSSNFERLLFDLYDRDATAVVDLMQQLKDQKGFTLPPEVITKAADVFEGQRVDEDETLATIGDVYKATGGYLLDPHTAIGVAAAERVIPTLPPDVPMVTLATAHPAKFPDAVERAAGVRPPLPNHISDLYDREERFDVLPNDLNAVQQHIAACTGR
ncbi:MAG: threonine synthase [Planctomycetota bacterium]